MAHRRSQASKDPACAEGDDFGPIKGIGPTTENRLHEAGILTLNQLSAASPKEIAAAATGRSAKRIAKEDWTGQARQLAQKASAEAQSSEAVSPMHEHAATFMVELLLDEDNNVRRTRVIYDEDKTEDAWNGWVEPRLVNFFVRYAGLHRPLPEPGAPSESGSPMESEVLSEAAAPPDETLEVAARERLPHSKLKKGLHGVLRVSDLIPMRLDSEVPQYLVAANQAFHARLLLDLSEARTSPLKSLHCAVTMWAKDLGTGERQIVGQGHNTFMPADHVPCTVECTIPSQGTYRLEALVTLTPASHAPGAALMAWLESGLLVIY